MDPFVLEAPPLVVLVLSLYSFQPSQRALHFYHDSKDSKEHTLVYYWMRVISVRRHASLAPAVTGSLTAAGVGFTLRAGVQHIIHIS